jgi:hypothetical protein
MKHIKIQNNISSISFSTCFLIENFDCRFLLSFSPCLLFDNFYFQFDNLIVGAKSIPKIVNSNIQIVVLQSEFFSVYPARNEVIPNSPDQKIRLFRPKIIQKKHGTKPQAKKNYKNFII